MQKTVAHDSRFSFVLILVFLIFAAGIGAGGYFNYHDYAQHFRREIEKDLAYTADFKVRELVQWRKERLGDASILFQNSAFSGLVRRYFENPQDTDSHGQLHAWLERIIDCYQYDRICLFDGQGVRRLTVPSGTPQSSSTLLKLISDVLRLKEIVFQDFYRDDYDQRIYLAILVPVIDTKDNNRVLGVLVLRIAPEQYLYPLLKHWPTPSQTAETLLVRREGDSALFLNELKYKKGTALNLRIPLSMVNTPAVQAALGHEGIVEGIDYRGVPVIADVRAVPETPWFMVARMDTAEVYVPMQVRLRYIVLFIILLIVLTGAALLLFWRQQRFQYYREKLKAAEELAESRQLLLDIINNSLALMYILDTEGRFLLANKKLADLFGTTPEQLTGRTRLDVMTQETADLHHANDLQVMRERKLMVFEEENQEADGKHIYLTMKYPLLRSDGKLYAVGGMSVDITERKLAEQELLEKNAELTRFAYTMSHDLRSPLVTVKTFLGYLEKDMQSQDAGCIEKDFAFIHGATDKMARLLDELLELMRIGRVVNSSVEAPLQDIVQEALGLVAGQIAERGVQVKITKQPLLLYGDRPRLVELFQNLIDNAVKFMGDQMEPKVEIGVTTKNNENVLFVRDNGLGIDPRHIEKMFGIFERFNPEVEGTGIGLALVKRIVEVHGGTIWVASEGLGKGACFWFSLPEGRSLES